VAIDLHSLSSQDLMSVWAGVAQELRRRELIRTNNIVGELAELVALRHFGGQRSGFSNTGFDLRTAAGELIQVKGLWKTTSSRNKLSAIRDPSYDSVVAVVFNAAFTEADAYKASRAVVERMFRHNARVNGRQITVTGKFINDPDVETINISIAYQSIISASLPAD
jgi:hypothetical protein